MDAHDIHRDARLRIDIVGKDGNYIHSQSVESNLLYEILIEMKKLNQLVLDMSMEQSEVGVFSGL